MEELDDDPSEDEETGPGEDDDMMSDEDDTIPDEDDRLIELEGAAKSGRVTPPT